MAAGPPGSAPLGPSGGEAAPLSPLPPTAPLAVLDRRGRVVGVSPAWRGLVELTDQAPAEGGVGLPYRRVAGRALGPGPGDMGQALLGISQPRPIHLLLTDVVMPGMSGWALARRLAGERPGLRVAFMSGYPAGGQAAAEREGFGSVAILGKPFTPQALARHVREALDGASGRGG